MISVAPVLLPSENKNGSFTKGCRKKSFEKTLEIGKKNLGDTIKARSFALPIKKRVAKTAKRSLKVWKQQQQKQVRLAQILI